ncbi:MAG: cyclic lactone autoinducer peptide [Clostridia bacterium]|nr:cyclic lactone autoinducer peptide [Clostridia bacterium]
MKKLCSVIGTLLTFIALISSSSASVWIFYQPKTPRSLLKS